MVYVTGDMHGDASRFSDPRLKKLKKGDTLLVCGDFGFLWNGSKAEQKLLKQIGSKKYNVCFLDGTHENFELLKSYDVIEWNGGKARQIYKNLYHLMRGQIYEIEGLKIFTMGGGESPDIDIRFDNDSWSRDEIPTQVELIEGANNLEKVDCKVDIILTHEPPATIKGFLKLKEKGPVRVTALNAYFEELANRLPFKSGILAACMWINISPAHIPLFSRIFSMSAPESSFGNNAFSPCRP